MLKQRNVRPAGCGADVLPGEDEDVVEVNEHKPVQKIP